MPRREISRMELHARQARHGLLRGERNHVVGDGEAVGAAVGVGVGGVQPGGHAAGRGGQRGEGLVAEFVREEGGEVGVGEVVVETWDRVGGRVGLRVGLCWRLGEGGVKDGGVVVRACGRCVLFKAQGQRERRRAQGRAGAGGEKSETDDTRT